MKRRIKLVTASLAMLTLALLFTPRARTDDPKRSEEQALHKRAEAFAATFNKGDPKGLAAFFTANADLVDPEGRQTKGREAIEKVYHDYFDANKGAKLTIYINSVRVARPDLALEDGVTEVIPPNGGPPSAARYSVVYVKQDGEWYLESVREAIAVPPSNADLLQDLAFLVGDWEQESDKGGGSTSSYSWAAQGNFLVNNFDVTLQDVPVGSGTQWIGWDQAEKKVRAWSFFFNGGFAEGVWNKDGDNNYKINVHATMRDGKKASATNIFTKIDPDHFSIQLVDRKIDGKALPDDKAITMRRVVR
jgi:uncharacterized protein (TIGR02246 family)